MKKRKILSLLMALLMVVGSIPFTTVNVNAALGGTGTSSDPYQIRTASDFNDIRKDLNAYYTICNDIDLSAYTNWVPLGDVVNPFTGRLMGNRYTIYGVQIGSVSTPSTAYNNTGLFGYVSKYGVLQDVSASVAIYNGGGSNCGGLVGKSEGYIVNSRVNGTVFSTAVDCNTGGLVGENAGNFVNCYGTANVTGGSRNHAQYLGTGGLVGLSTGVTGVTNCYNAGNVTGFSDSYAKVGTVVGYNYRGVVSNCYWDSASIVTVNGGHVNLPVGSTAGEGVGASVVTATVSALGTAIVKGTGNATINGIKYMNTTEGNIVNILTTLTDALNPGRGAITVEQLPSGVKASAWGTDSANVNNGYPVFTSASTLDAVFTKGNGFITDPYIVETAAQLDDIRNHTITIDGATYTGGYYKLGNDIDLTGYSSSVMAGGWVSLYMYLNKLPSGVVTSSLRPFGGVFDGNGYKITFNGCIGYGGGIFGEISKCGVIKNLTVDCKDANTSAIGDNYGIINNCHVTGNINAPCAFGDINRGVIANCYSSADLINPYALTPYGSSGFLVCTAFNSMVTNSCSTGNITTSGDYTGGFINQAAGYMVTVINCYSAGNITMAPAGTVGGFVATTEYSMNPFVNCYWNISDEQIKAGIPVASKTGNGYYSNGISPFVIPLLSPVGITADVMKGATASIDYFDTQYEDEGTKTANSFIEALDGGRSAVGTNFIYNSTAYIYPNTVKFTVPLAKWAYVPGVNNDYPIPLTPETPEITTQPSGKTISSGNTVTFQAGAVTKDGGTISYQWQKSTDGATWTNVAEMSGSTSVYTTANSKLVYRNVKTSGQQFKAHSN